MTLTADLGLNRRAHVMVETLCADAAALRVGVSRGEARLFLDRVVGDEVHPVRVWINLASVEEVDALHREWHAAGVPIPAAPESKPWGLYEFTAADDDGNSFRVFHDTATPGKKAGCPGGKPVVEPA